TLGNDGPAILRAWSCSVVPFDRTSDDDILAPLSTVAPLGSTLEIPMDAPKLDGASDIAPVLDGLPARDRFFVRTLDESGSAKQNVPVRWSVVTGSAFFDGVQPALSQHDVVNDSTEPDGTDGISGIAVHAGATASSIGDGKISVEAHVAGFE